MTIKLLEATNGQLDEQDQILSQTDALAKNEKLQIRSGNMC